MSKISSVRIGRHQIGRFRFLLLSLMMMIGLRPFLDEWISSRIWADVLTDIFFAFALMSGLHAVRGQPRQLRFALLLAAAIILLGLLHYTLQVQLFFRLQQGLGGVFLIQMLFMIWIHIEKENEVTLDLIMASACAYILIGWYGLISITLWKSSIRILSRYRGLRVMICGISTTTVS